MKRLLLMISAAAISILARAGSNADGVPDPSPAFEQSQFVVPEGFQISLFASEPMVRKPVQMNWDRRGRLWVVCSTLYPQIKPGEIAHDEVIILEDTNHDGVADTSKVFAEGLHIPTAILPYGDGALVVNSTELVWLHDRNGDDKVDPDGQEILLSGFGTEDTHHLVHTLKQGPDGRVYFMQSTYIHSHLETPFGVRRLLGGGIWMYDPASGRAEIYSMGFINPWGLVFDQQGQAFVCDGAGGQGINFAFPGSNHAWSMAPNVPELPGLNPGQPKQSGLEIIDSPTFPDDMQGQLIADDFRGNRLNRFKLSDKGSGYESKQQADVLSSPDRAFRPIDIRFGPDGALYIADFYNPIIQHGEVDFRDPRRDHEHGRIWRLTAKGRPLLSPPNLQKLSKSELRKTAVEGPGGWAKHFAKVELAARGDSNAWQTNGKDQALRDVMKAATTPDAWATKVPDDFKATTPRERLWWVCYASRGFMEHQSEVSRRSVEMLPALLKILDQPMDNWIDFALATYCRKTAATWLPALQSGKIKIGNPDHLVYALKSSGDARALDLLIGPLLEGKLPATVWNLAAEQGDAAFLGRLFAAAENPKVAPQIFETLIAAARQRNIKPSGDLTQVLKRLDDAQTPTTLRAGAATLAGLWEINAARPALERIAGDAAEKIEVREGALSGIASLGGAESSATLSKIASSDANERAQASAVLNLLRIDATAAAKSAAEFLAKTKTESFGSDIVMAFAQTKNGPTQLTASLTGKTLDATVATAGFRAAGSAALRDTSLADALRTAGGLKPVTQSLDANQIASLVKRVKSEGDPARGEELFRRPQLLCTICHAIGTVGGQIGPNLQSVGASAQPDYLIESLMEPSKKIKEGYHTTTITTKDGQIFSGMLVKNGEQLVIRDASAVEHTIEKKQVAKNEVSPVSLMPPGLTSALSEPEFIDLVRFLSELGRDGEFLTPPNRYVRTWEAKQTDGSWRPLTARVSGKIPLTDAPGRALRATFDVPGTVASNIYMEAPPKGITRNLDGKPFNFQRPIEPGPHKLELDWADTVTGFVRVEIQ